MLQAGRAAMDHINPLRWRGLSITLTLAILVGASGCGGPRLYPVQGRVLFPDGTPLKGGWVVFEPVEATDDVSARGRIQSDGTFRLGTVRDDDGAVAGRHRVLVVPPLPPKLDERNPPPPPIHARFRSFDTSNLAFVVKPGPNEFEIRVEKP
jgi:hypothetical protein